jgi:hypothetical protein
MIDELDLAIGLNSEIHTKDLKLIKENLLHLIEKLSDNKVEVENSSVLKVRKEISEKKSYLHPFQGFYSVLN